MSDGMMTALIQALVDGNQAEAIASVGKLGDAGISKERIVTEGIEAAMEQLDAKCTVEQFNLLEIMLSGRAVMGVMKELYPADAPPPRTKGDVVIGALEGDVHDLGKNIFKMVLTASGYRVVDCGKDCPLDRMLDAAEEEAALAIGISGLISTVIPQVRRVKELIAGRGLGHIKVLAGGAALKQSSPESLNVDYVAQTTFSGLHYLNRITGNCSG